VVKTEGDKKLAESALPYAMRNKGMEKAKRMRETPPPLVKDVAKPQMNFNEVFGERKKHKPKKGILEVE